MSNTNKSDGAPSFRRRRQLASDRHPPHLDVTTKVVEGVPKDVIVLEATEWHADRAMLGSHGYGKVGRAVLGSTAAVAAEAPCSC